MKECPIPNMLTLQFKMALNMFCDVEYPDEPAPCANCGGEAIVHEIHTSEGIKSDSYAVCCTECLMETSRSTREEVIRNWNHRIH